MDLRKYSPVRADVNLAVMDAVETGLFVKWSHEKLPMEAFLDYNGLQTYDEKKPMKFQQLFLSLLFCATGLALGAVTLSLESIRARLRRSREPQTYEQEFRAKSINQNAETLLNTSTFIVYCCSGLQLIRNLWFGLQPSFQILYFLSFSN